MDTNFNVMKYFFAKNEKLLKIEIIYLFFIYSFYIIIKYKTIK